MKAISIEELNPMDWEHEVHKTVRGQRGVSKRWADEMNMPHSTFLAKANPARTDVHFTAEELQEFVAISGNARILSLFVEPFGLELCEVAVSGENLLRLHFTAESEHAEAVAAQQAELVQLKAVRKKGKGVKV